MTKAEADTIEELAEKLEIDPEGAGCDGADYNAACQPGNYNPAILDGVAPTGITPPKSNWALPIDKPPYVGFVVTCGITFTFGGLKIDEHGEVQDLVGPQHPRPVRRGRAGRRPVLRELSWAAPA